MQVAAWLTHIKTDTIAYPACTLQYNGKQCNKKVVEASSGDGPGQWYCDRCTAHCQAEWRYMLNLRLEDHTGTEWVTAFQVRCLKMCWRWLKMQPECCIQNAVIAVLCKKPLHPPPAMSCSVLMCA